MQHYAQLCLHQQHQHHSTCGQQLLLTENSSSYIATISTSNTCVEANILFDEGSQRSFITKSLADCLQLQTHGTEELAISIFGAQTSQIKKLDVTTNLGTLHDEQF